jgi:4-hydroxy-tetrahydrodipicolinate reductase
MAEIRVLVSGSGRMGTEVLAGLCAAEGVRPVGVLEGLGSPGTVALPDGSGEIPFGPDPATLARETNADVVVDFTFHEWTVRAMPPLIDAGVRPVIATSGLSEAQVSEIAERCRARGIGGVWASNFAIGAVLMMHFARLAAPHYAAAEVIELHHDGKVDAPSGTALATARAMEAARGAAFHRQQPSTVTVPGTRGGEAGGVSIHSVRLPGLVAHQEVIFGGAGEVLTLRHDSLARSSFIPGVLLAVRAVMKRAEFVRGLEPLLGLTAPSAGT